MHFETFNKLFRFRYHCLCGLPLQQSFGYKSVSDNDIISITPNGSHSLNDAKNEIHFSFNIQSNKDHNANIDITSYISTPTFISKAAYLTNSSLKRISAIEFVKSHLSNKIQKRMNIYTKLKCGAVYPKTPCTYLLRTKPITFTFSPGFNSSNGIIKPIELESEYFKISNDGKHYRCYTDFENNKTVITYKNPKTGFVIGSQDKITVPADYFLKYPLDEALLVNKIKTLILFS